MTSPNAFRNLWDLGYRRLLPIAPPDANVPADSRLTRSRGKAPAILCADGLWRSMRGWRDVEPSPDTLDNWASWGAGVGIALGPQEDGLHLYAIDADTLDGGLADTIRETLAGQQGTLPPIRIGRRPKALYLIRCVDQLAYRCVKFTGRDGKLERVELLVEGKQFVAHGIHPQTNSPYRWPNGVPALADVPLVDPVDIDLFFDTLADILPAGQVDNGSLPANRANVDQARLRGDPDLVASAMAALPNSDALFGHYDQWIRVGEALHAATAADPDLGEELWLQWCARYPERENSDERDIGIWRSFKAPHSIGADYLYEMAERHGDWQDRPKAYFSPVNDNEVGLFDHPVHTPAGIPLYTIDDIYARPDTAFAVARHIPERSFGFLYGAPGSFKSFLALDLSMHLAYGLPEWHGDALAPMDGIVLYVAREGASGFKARLQAWHEGRILPDGRRPAFRHVEASLNFMVAEDIQRLVAAVRGAGLKASLVIVDTVSRVIPGADENAQKDMTLFVRACERLMEEFGCMVIGVHHTNKAGDMRGSSVFLGQGDFIFRTEAIKETSRKAVRLTCEKQKDGDDGWTDTYELRPVRASLVPVRLSKSEAVKVVSAGRSGDILEAMEAAWREGKPWRQRGREGAVGVMHQQFGMAKDEAEKLLQTWLATGAVTYKIFDKKMKLSGFRPSQSEPPKGVFE